MTTASPTQNLLVKTHTGALPAALSLGADAIPFTVEHLFTSIGASAELGVTADGNWHLLKASAGLDGQNPWDLCHKMMQGGSEFAVVSDVEFAEPDLQQQWLIGNDVQLGFALESCDPNPQNEGYPHQP